MLIEIKIKNSISKLRTNPTISSPIINTYSPSIAIYNATKMYNGWYYLTELNGWVESTDIVITNIITPYDPAIDTYAYDTNDISPKELAAYDIEKIINLINNNRTKFINCARVVYREDGGETEIPIMSLIERLRDGLDGVDAGLKILNTLTLIPSIPTEFVPNSILTIDATGKLKWTTPDDIQIDKYDPTKNPNYTNDF